MSGRPGGSQRVNFSLVTVAITVASVLLPATLVTQFIGTAGIVICSGIAVMGAMKFDSLPLRYRLALCLATGFLVFLCVGAGLGATLSALGLARPLSRLPLACSWIVLLAGLAVVIVRSDTDPVRRLLDGVTARHVAWCAVLSVPPLIALWGAASLNTYRSGAIAVAVSLLVVAMAALAILVDRWRWGPPRVLLLMSSVVTGALQGPLRGAWLAGVDTQHEYYVGTLAIHEAVFPLTPYVDPYGGMLSLTVLPTEMHSLFAVNLRTTMVVLPSLFVGFCVLVLWSALTERATPRTSALLSCLFILGSVSLLQELPQITRQCYALFFFSILVLALSTKVLSTAQARWAAVIGGVGVAVTHYTTAYLAAGAVLCGFAFSLAMRQDRMRRVLSAPVTVAVVGVAVLWGALVARTGDGIGRVLSSIRADGLDFLPSGGGLIDRWLNGASINKLVNASVIRAQDLALLHHGDRWLKVTPRASLPSLVNDPAVTSHGVPILGGLLSIGSSLITQFVLLLAAASVVVVIYQCRRRRELTCLAGAAAFFLVFSAISRFSQTIGVDFSPSRVETQAYMLLVVVVAVALEPLPWRAWLAKLHLGRQVLLTVGVVAAVVAIVTSTQLVSYVKRGAPLPATLSFQGEETARLITPDDVAAAQWLTMRRAAPKLVQADFFGELALDVYGFNDRKDFVNSVDPVIVGNLSWVFAYHTNLFDGSARGGNNAEIGVFKFPLQFFLETRSVLYTSSTDAVFGTLPYHGP